MDLKPLLIMMMGDYKKEINNFLKEIQESRAWWRMPLIPALGRQRQVNLCEFEASLVYRESFRTPRATERNPGLKKI